VLRRTQRSATVQRDCSYALDAVSVIALDDMLEDFSAYRQADVLLARRPRRGGPAAPRLVTADRRRSSGCDDGADLRISRSPPEVLDFRPTRSITTSPCSPRCAATTRRSPPREMAEPLRGNRAHTSRVACCRRRERRLGSVGHPALDFPSAARRMVSAALKDDHSDLFPEERANGDCRW